MTEFTAADKLACAERELKYRRRVYPRRVAESKMTQKLADHETACMQAIVLDYQKKAESERLI